MHKSCHTHEWVMSHIWMSQVTHMNESCHTYEWVMLHIWMSHVTHMNKSCHKYEWAMTTFHFLTGIASVIFGKIIAYMVNFHIWRDNHICDRICGPWLTCWEILSYNHPSLKSEVKSEYVNIFCKWFCDGCNAATHFSTLQHTATHYHTLPHTLRHAATHCNTLQHTATHCNTLQHTATQWLCNMDFVACCAWLPVQEIVIMWWIVLHLVCGCVMQFVACWLCGCVMEFVGSCACGCVMEFVACWVWLCDGFCCVLCVIISSRGSQYVKDCVAWCVVCADVWWIS